MSTLTPTTPGAFQPVSTGAPGGATGTADALRVTFPQGAALEWTKFRSLRSSPIALAVAAVAAVGLGAAISFGRGSHVGTAGDVGRALFDPASTSLDGIFLAELAVGVLGVLLVTGEYATGSIRSTLSAVPRRLTVLGAKTSVYGAVALLFGLVISLAAFLVGQAILSNYHLSTTLSAPGVLRAVAGGALFLALVGLLGVGLGFLLRSSAGAISALVGLMFLLTIAVNFLPTSWANEVSPWLPASAGRALVTVRAVPHQLSWGVALAVLAAYAAVALVTGGVTLRRRDA